MSMLKIRKYGDTILNQKCKPVTKIDDKIRRLANDMLQTMYTEIGVGLAANQVGISLRLCVIDVRPEGKKQPIVLINPKIVSKKGKIKEEEGCLSFPGIIARVKRYKQVYVEAINENGMPIIVEAKDFLSRAVQHELDHLDGKVFINHLPFLQRTKIKREIKKRKKLGMW